MKTIVLLKTIALLTLSNVFMTFAWYGHLKHKATLTIPMAILVSWLIALPEYCFQVPANRLGSESMSTPQLKILQEVITLSVFSVFSVWYLGERIRWNDVLGFLCILAAVFFVFAFKEQPKQLAAGVIGENSAISGAEMSASTH